jgi:hypothetical protein
MRLRVFSGEGMMGAEDWPALLTAYQAALEEFERVTKTLTLLLADRTSTPEDFRGVFAAEAKARDLVVLSRMRLMNAWREDQPDLELADLLARVPRKHV